MADPHRDELHDSGDNLPENEDDEPVEIVCPQCRHSWTQPSGRCPQCGAETDVDFIATYRLPMPGAGRKLAWVALVGLALLVILAIIALSIELGKGSGSGPG